jgi:hypothetical protein
MRGVENPAGEKPISNSPAGKRIEPNASRPRWGYQGKTGKIMSISMAVDPRDEPKKKLMLVSCSFKAKPIPFATMLQIHGLGVDTPFTISLRGAA